MTVCIGSIVAFTGFICLRCDLEDKVVFVGLVELKLLFIYIFRVEFDSSRGECKIF